MSSSVQPLLQRQDASQISTCMKILLVFLMGSVISVSVSLADQTLNIEDVGVSVVVPDDWRHDETDSFGYLIRPEGEEYKKVRLHLVGDRSRTPEESARNGMDRGNALRAKENLPLERILSSAPVVTESGIKGVKVEVGSQRTDATSYIAKMYLQKTDGHVFCVCIYHYGDSVFLEKAEAIILKTMEFKS